MNMSSAMLQRIHLGGNLDLLTDDMFAAVQEGIQCYKKIRKEIPNGIPFWPTGFHSFDAGWLVFGLHLTDKDLLTVCRREDEDTRINIPVKRRIREVRVIYPLSEPRAVCTSDDNCSITVELDQMNSAVIVEAVYECSGDI